MQEFRKLSFATNQTTQKGVDPDGSQQAWDLYDRTRDDTIRRWQGAFAEGGRKALMRFEAGGSACVLSEAQRGKLVGWVRAASPRSTGQIGAWIASEFGVEYESRSGLVALLHRLGLEYRKPEVIPRHLDETKQRAFIKLYEKLMNALGADEAVLFVDAVHPTHGRARRDAGRLRTSTWRSNRQ